MIEKLQFLEYKKFIPEKPFSHMTFQRIPTIPGRLRSQGVLGDLRGPPAGRNLSQGSQESQRSLGSGTVSHFSTMPGQSKSKRNLKLVFSLHLSEISLKQDMKMPDAVLRKEFQTKTVVQFDFV